MVTQRALAEAGRASRQPLPSLCPAVEYFHAHAEKCRKGVLFQSEVFPNEVCTAERQSTPRHPLVQEFKSPLLRNPCQVLLPALKALFALIRSPGTPSCSAFVEVGST